ncbi:hypothetical protein GCM10007973_01600 [Polymorphobacter multimanifer]|uniref:Uncharacterized protein n=1 Tax=Polymorphobacter multimanifer TaxID=1070431 RepID=A0A841L4A4_9SPHN|nr:hypothetical protein [Polymorphobacter multimanifer]MBB6227464.1 hypothetical protein [Polymorphobacter multimanifer]GGI68183.1 hypothetical protein GCM10007973_01600 [Polymorphobacter multimanifer]
MAGRVKSADAAEVTVEAVGEIIRALVNSTMNNERDRQAIEFVITLSEQSAALIIESARHGRMPTKRDLVLMLTERVRAIVTFAAADVDMIQCFSAVVDLVITTAGSTRNTVLIAKTTASGSAATAAVPVVSALIALGGTVLTTAVVCAAAFEVVQGFLLSLDKCGPLLKADPRGVAALGRMRLVDGFPQQNLVIA